MQNKGIKGVYFRIHIPVVGEDTPALALFNAQNKKQASENFFKCIRAEIEVFKQAAAKRGGVRQPGAIRTLYLLSLPEYQEEIVFLKGNNRRLEVRSLLKEIVLTGGIALSTKQRVLGYTAQKDNTTNLAPAVEQPAQNKELGARLWFPDAPSSAKPSPLVLLGETNPESVMRLMLEELLPQINSKNMQPEQLRYNWLAIPPDDYPATIKESPMFTILRQYGNLYAAKRTEDSHA